MQHVAARVEKQWGHINGIIHSAGLPDGGLIPTRTREMSETVLAPKVKGTLVLETLFRSERNREKLDFLVLRSSLNSVLSAVGQVAYSAANAFLDSYAWANASGHHTYTVAINWDNWQEVGMAVEAEEQLKASSANLSPGKPGFLIETLKDALLPAEGVEVFRQVLAKGKWPQVLISTTDLLTRIKESRAVSAKILLDRLPPGTRSIPQHPRPELSTPYAAPGTGTQQRLVHLWQQFLGIAPVGIHDDFFELGGDSLKVMTISTKIHKEFNVEIPLTEFFNNPTIKKLAQYIDKTGKRSYSPIKPVELKEYYPLSPAQQRLYMLQRMDPQSTAYNLVHGVMLEGEPDRYGLEKVLSTLINRHESLKTGFIIIDGEVVQKVHDEVAFVPGYRDITGARGEVRIEDEEEQSPHSEGTRGLAPLPGNPTVGSWHLVVNTIKNFTCPFDLTQAPLLRTSLIKTAPAEHILLLDIHHIISDGTSIALFIKEFMALNEHKELPPINIQYKDYSHWRNNQNRKQTVNTAEKYWLKELAGNIPALNLPTDFPRPTVQSLAGDLVTFTLSSEHTGHLKEIASRQEVSLFAVLLALLNVFISKITGQEDILMGTQVAGRNHADLQHIIGVFINTLVLRNYPHKEKTFLTFLQEIKNRTLQAFENQEYPFEDLVEKILGKRELNRNPLFDVMFVWQNMEIEQIRIPGLTLKPLQDEAKQTALIDLTLYGYDGGEQLSFKLEYSTTLFKKETIERFIKYLKEIISCVIANKEIKLKDIKIAHDLGMATTEVFREEDEEFGF